MNGLTSPTAVAPPTLEPAFAEGEVIYSIEAMELRFTYEPIIRVQDWMCVGAEARVSWRHPRRGLLASDVVMPYIERMPRRVAVVTEVILDEATASCRRWRDEGHAFGVWVRLPAGLRHEELAARASRLTRANRVPADALTIQLCGGASRGSLPSAQEAAADLHAAGIRVAIEHDAMPPAASAPPPMVSELAISLPEDADAANIGVSTLADVVSEAKRQRLTTVCRNVASRAAWDAAETLGCDLAQGRFIARAASAPDFSRWARRWMSSACAPSDAPRAEQLASR